MVRMANGPLIITSLAKFSLNFRGIAVTFFQRLAASCILDFFHKAVSEFPGLEVNFLVNLQSFSSTSKIFFSSKMRRPLANSFQMFGRHLQMIVTHKPLLVAIFLTRRLSKLLAFWEFASDNFERWSFDFFARLRNSY